MTSACRTTLTTTHRVIHRVHRHAAIVWLTSKPTLATGFAKADVHVVRVANHTNSGSAITAHTTHFTTWQGHLSPLAFAGCQGAAASCGASKLTTTAWLKFDVVNRHTQWYFAQWQAISGLWFRFVT
jgi:hypothetical protein